MGSPLLFFTIISMITYQVKLKKPGKGVWVQYPEDFSGQRTDDELEVFIDQAPRPMSKDEIAYVRQYLEGQGIANELEETEALFLDAEDPIAKLDHEQLDRLEENLNLSNTRTSNAGGERTTLERVLILRESYSGNDLYETVRAFLTPAESKSESEEPKPPEEATPPEEQKTPAPGAT